MLTWLKVSGAALVCAGVGLGVAGCGGTAGAAGPVPTTTTVAPSSSTPAPRRHDGVTGQITSESGTSWVLTTKAGERITVMITTNTKFGTAAHPATAQQFPVGSTVRVAGAVDGTTVTATRVVVPEPRPSQSPTPTPTPSPTT